MSVAIPVRLIVGKGTSVEVAKDRWRKVYYQLEIDMTFDKIEEVTAYKDKVENVIDGWISKHTGKASSYPQPIPASEIPQLDLAEVDALPWKGKNGVDRQKGGWGWIFSDVKEVLEKHEPEQRRLVSELGRAIRGSKNHLQLGDMIYSYGKDTKFMNRHPIKRESAR